MLAPRAAVAASGTQRPSASVGGREGGNESSVYAMSAFSPCNGGDTEKLQRILVLLMCSDSGDVGIGNQVSLYL